MATRKCKNPSFIKGRLKKVPKGKRKGATFLHKGKRYMVMSYVTKTGKRVRYAKAVVKSLRSAKRLGRRNPLMDGKGAFMFNPLLRGTWRPAAGTRVGTVRIVRRKGMKVRKVVMRLGKRKGKVRRKIGRYIGPVAYKAPKAPKGAKSGAAVTRGGKRFVVVRYTATKGKAKGKRIAILRRMPKKK